ncbi:MAG TPA: SprT family zinc-dependent metalloprotease [Patescibacteria group bacterium]|nr:SprT family zinc-dependent metalloprotease [Patescibacteria group bacterium]
MQELEHLGVTYQLNRIPVFDDRMLWLEGDKLCVVDLRDDDAHVLSILLRWTEREAKRHLTERVRILTEVTGWDVRKVSFRRQTTIWGSCSSKKHLSLNLELVKLAPDVIDYVIIHELAHTVELNHSRAFWNLVAMHCPDYPVKKAALRAFERKRLTNR